MIPAKTVTSFCESVLFIDQRLGPIHQRRLGAIHHNNMMPSTSDMMPSISESVTHCQSRKVTTQSLHQSWVERDSLSTLSWRRPSQRGIGVGCETLEVLNTWGQTMITVFTRLPSLSIIPIFRLLVFLCDFYVGNHCCKLYCIALLQHIQY